MVDAVVVGGGIVGAAAAYHLARAGVRTVLVDRRDPGRATDAGAGIITPGGNPGSADPWSRLVGQAEAYYPALVGALEAEGAGDTGYAVCGSLLVAVSPDEREAFEEASAEVLPEDRARGRSSRVVSEGRAKELFPPLGRVVGAVYAPTAARVDGRLIAAALERAAVGRGLQKRAGCVERLEAGQGRVTALVVDGERLEAGHVVIAGGAWSEALGRQLGVTIPVVPQRGQIAHLDLGEVETSGWPIVSGMRHHYLVPWDDHRVVAGATRETGSGFTTTTTVAGIAEVMLEALRVAPGLAGASVREVRVGLRPVSADGYPVIGKVPGVANALVATGHGAMGLHLGPFSGRLVAEMIADGAPSCDAAAFGADRFGRLRG